MMFLLIDTGVIVNMCYILSRYLKKYALQAQSTIKTSLRASDKGSVTLEAALILPIVLFVLYGFIILGQLIYVDDEVSKGINETCRYIAKDAYDKEDYNPSVITLLKFREYVDENKLAMVDGGVSGVLISCKKSDDDILHLNASYKVHIKLPLIGNYSFNMTDTSAVRPFDGYDPDKAGDDDEYVYVAETGGVYHTDMNCTYITVRIVDKDDASLKGKTYCHHCKNHHASGKYVTVSGSKIHKDINCSSLKRTVHLVKKSEIKGLPLCSKCAGGVKH